MKWVLFASIVLLATGCGPDPAPQRSPRSTIDWATEHADSLDARTQRQNRRLDTVLEGVDETSGPSRP